MSDSIARNTIGLAAEYAVASELCRRGIYAQLTFGNQKRTDILVFSPAGKVAKIEVKSKQGSDWPNCRGISDKDAFLIFVDYQKRPLDRAPDFYILSERDWRRVLERRVADILDRDPKKKIKIMPENYSVFVDHIGANGKPYVGMGIRAAHLARYKDCWAKIEKKLGAS